MQPEEVNLWLAPESLALVEKIGWPEWTSHDLVWSLRHTGSTLQVYTRALATDLWLQNSTFTSDFEAACILRCRFEDWLWTTHRAWIQPGLEGTGFDALAGEGELLFEQLPLRSAALIAAVKACLEEKTDPHAKVVVSAKSTYVTREPQSSLDAKEDRAKERESGV